MANVSDTIHPQVRCLDFECDEELAELLTLMNQLGIATMLSCQDNNAGIGRVRRVWVEIGDWDLADFLGMLDDPAELDDPESLSSRIAAGDEPDDWEDYRADRAWHYDKTVMRLEGEIFADPVGIRFPYSDLPEVVARLRRAVDAHPLQSPEATEAAPSSQPEPSGPPA